MDKSFLPLSCNNSEIPSLTQIGTISSPSLTTAGILIVSPPLLMRALSAIRGRRIPCLQPHHPFEWSEYTLEEKHRHIVYTAETHNFPTAVCPFEGAATGGGGRIRLDSPTLSVSHTLSPPETITLRVVEHTRQLRWLDTPSDLFFFLDTLFPGKILPSSIRPLLLIREQSLFKRAMELLTMGTNSVGESERTVIEREFLQENQSSADSLEASE